MGIATHKLRSFLTILGVVIGVGAVIALMSVGKGAEQAIISNIQGLGADLLFIRPGVMRQSGSGGTVRMAFGSARTLTLEDAQAITDEISNVAEVAPSSNSSVQAVVGSENMRAQVVGVTPAYQSVNSINMTEGSFITEADNQSMARVAVIGSNVQATLFPDSDPVGQTIRASNYVIRVVGVMGSSGTSITGTTDDSILIPLNTLQLLTGQQRTSRGDHVVNSISVRITDPKYATQVTDDISLLLRQRHDLLLDGSEDDFTVTSIQQIMTSISSTSNQLTLLLGAIAGISLLVGGIGVMNIMLVSVMERRREIGIRKALGAKQRDIWGQFLIEAAMLTFTGGVIGVAAGWAASYFVQRSGLMPSVVTADVVVLAVSVAIGVGLFFGFYPAWQASRLNPIEALRSE
jgi:putative ABC transport system permease protein